ncbi:kinase-like domain-containing protein [Lasiosphaeria miniovina]|uniref:Kinase-like domain-containing protein n=1 Tax=Lasiosphaeria miniovina TaxID=1954250 RepID=A0AA40AW10_9PEZI|nr:kinase-like domain-containing protein [Lasiosphaeria miniovina]KAK0723001.1 kinase-like domain-containing protein [Lasiosphaeria miniovina]
MESLFRRLDKEKLPPANARSSLDNRKFVPFSVLKKLITEENVRIELARDEGQISRLVGWFNPPIAPTWVPVHAPKIFAALVLMGRSQGINNLLNENLTDEHLPLSRDPQDSTTEFCESHDKSQFWLRGLGEGTVSKLVDEYQFIFQAPVLDTKGRLVSISEQCPLPFVTSSVESRGGAGIVHKATIHPDHQIGFEAETDDRNVAVKEFLHKDDFEKEHRILEQLEGLRHPNIIRHFASIDRMNTRYGYIIFPWVDGGNLQEFWTTEPETSQARVLWALQQMSGLTEALHLLHDRFNCRHGDIKPLNILCVKEVRTTRQCDPVLKIADFGISSIHEWPTVYRKAATFATHLTPSYQGPEVEFEGLDKHSPRPRSRKYDIWSLGCVFLEFTLWLLYGPDAIIKFAEARGASSSSREASPPMYEVTDKKAKVAVVHQLVTKTIKYLERDPRCEGDTALAALLDLIRGKMIKPKVDDRPWALEVVEGLNAIIAEADEEKKGSGYLLRVCSGQDIAPPNFEPFTGLDAGS